MSISLVDIAKAYVESETPNRRKKTEGRLNELRKKYAPGGDWQLIQPGPLWEACQILLEETRQFGLDMVHHVVQHADARQLLGQPAEVEQLRRFIYNWAEQEREDYILSKCEVLIDERGIKANVKEQQLGNTRERIEGDMAEATKAFLAKVAEAGQAARAGSA